MTIETMQDVVSELKRRGFDATLEYPGFIATTSSADEPTRIHWGDADPDEFLGNVMSADLDSVIETIDSSIPSDSTDIQRLADHIACHSSAPECPRCGNPKSLFGCFSSCSAPDSAQVSK